MRVIRGTDICVVWSMQAANMNGAVCADTATGHRGREDDYFLYIGKRRREHPCRATVSGVGMDNEEDNNKRKRKGKRQ